MHNLKRKISKKNLKKIEEKRKKDFHSHNFTASFDKENRKFRERERNSLTN